MRPRASAVRAGRIGGGYGRSKVLDNSGSESRSLGEAGERGRVKRWAQAGAARSTSFSLRSSCLVLDVGAGGSLRGDGAARRSGTPTQLPVTRTGERDRCAGRMKRRGGSRRSSRAATKDSPPSGTNGVCGTLSTDSRVLSPKTDASDAGFAQLKSNKATRRPCLSSQEDLLRGPFSHFYAALVRSGLCLTPCRTTSRRA